MSSRGPIFHQHNHHPHHNQQHYHCHSVTLVLFVTPSIHIIINQHNHYLHHCIIIAIDIIVIIITITITIVTIVLSLANPGKSLNYQNRTVILLCSLISSGDSGAVEKCRNQEPSFSVPDSVSAISVAPIDQTIRPRPAYCVQKPHGSVRGADECLTLVWNIAKSERVVANCSA